MTNTWIPLWSQVVDSTLWEEPLEVRVLFLTMLALKDVDHVVRMPFRRLCKKSNMEPEKVQAALGVLMAPDRRSLDEQPDEGRRVRKVEDGWFIINGRHYQEEMSRLMRRLQKTRWQREHREQERKTRKRGNQLPGEAEFCRMERAGEDVSQEPGAKIPLPQHVEGSAPVNGEGGNHNADSECLV